MKKKLLCLTGFIAGIASGMEYFADAQNGNDEWDGSSATYVSGNVGPKKTVGAAVDLANADGEPSVVTLLPGLYDRGEYFMGGMTNRIVITQPHLKIRSMEGKETVFLSGHHDQTDPHGFGPAAVRVAYIAENLMGMGNASADIQATNVVFEGVTICNGATLKASTGGDGGGVYCNTPDGGGASLLIDCVVSNCSAFARGGALFRQNAYRTLFAGNYAGTGGSAMAFGSMAFCVVADNLGESTTYNMRRAVNCTFANNEKYAFLGGYEMYIYNCISFGNGDNGSSPNGNIHVYYYDTVAASPMRVLDAQQKENLIKDADPLWFAHSADYGWRLLSGCPAIGRGKGYRIKEKALLLPPGYSYCDFYGTAVDTSGTLDCGAVQDAPLLMCVIEADGGDISVEGANSGTNIFMEASEVTVTATSAHARPFVGFEVDGELQPLESDRFTLEIAEGSKTVRAIYASTWYVDERNGSDSNFGGILSNAKKTIRAATANAVAGDVVLVAAGTYGESEGVQFHSAPIDDDKTSPINVGSRVIVPYGVTVRSLEGPEKTVITGRMATYDTDIYGNGPDAVRCAMLEGSGSVLEGFTLTGGHTSTGSAARDDNDGGAILARTSAIARSCIITNNFAARSGAALKTTLVDCRILDNTATVRASVGRECGFYRCIIDGNMGGEQAMQYFYDVDSCTIGQNNLDLNGSKGTVLGYYASSASKIVNSIILGAWLSKTPHCTIQNCAFTSKPGNVADGDLVDCVVTNLEFLALDEEYRPVIGSNAAIDSGNDALLAYRIADGMDIYSGQRIMNGRMDIGAVEADWRDTYARFLGKRNIAVSTVSPEAFATESGRICVPTGSIECAVSVANSNSKWFDVDFEISGTGAFNIYVDGSIAGSYAAGQSSARLPAPSGDFTVRLEYVPGEDDVGAAFVRSVRMVAGMVVTIR